MKITSKFTKFVPKSFDIVGLSSNCVSFEGMPYGFPYADVHFFWGWHANSTDLSKPPASFSILSRWWGHRFPREYLFPLRKIPYGGLPLWSFNFGHLFIRDYYARGFTHCKGHYALSHKDQSYFYWIYQVDHFGHRAVDFQGSKHIPCHCLDQYFPRALPEPPTHPEETGFYSTSYEIANERRLQDSNFQISYIIAGEDAVARLKSFTCMHVAHKVVAFQNGCSSFAEKHTGSQVESEFRNEDKFLGRPGEGSVNEHSKHWNVVVVWDRELPAVSRQRGENHDMSLEASDKRYVGIDISSEGVVCQYIILIRRTSEFGDVFHLFLGENGSIATVFSCVCRREDVDDEFLLVLEDSI